MPEEKSPANLAMAAQIRAEQHAAQMTQQQLAAKSGVNYETLKRLLKGSRDITATQIVDLAGAFGIEPAVLVQRAVDRMPVSAAATTPDSTDYEDEYEKGNLDLAAHSRDSESDEDETYT